jgi:hypothetical protein
MPATNTAAPTNTRPPRGFKTNRKEGTLGCPHRNASCCDECVAKYPEIVEVFGAHCWIGDAAERAAFLAEPDDYVAPECAMEVNA